jgi:hypothetical protein
MRRSGSNAGKKRNEEGLSSTGKSVGRQTVRPPSIRHNQQEIEAFGAIRSPGLFLGIFTTP